MHRLTLTEVDRIRTLIAVASRHSAADRAFHRLHGVLLVGAGQSCYRVAEWFGEHPRTIERWVHAFERQGYDGLHNRMSHGRPARLSRDALQRLALDIRRAPLLAGYPDASWSGALFRRHLDARYGVRLGLRQSQRVYRRLAAGVATGPADAPVTACRR